MSEMKKDEIAEDEAQIGEEMIDDAMDEIEAVSAERDDMRDRFMRALADAENIRKRGERDRREAEQYGGSKLARDMLPVYDNLHRALEAVTEEQQQAAAGPDRRRRTDPARTSERVRQARDDTRSRRKLASGLIRSCIRRCSRRRCPAPRPATSSR